jgi:outer membrane protein assembly factor BamB
MGGWRADRVRGSRTDVELKDDTQDGSVDVDIDGDVASTGPTGRRRRRGVAVGVVLAVVAAVVALNVVEQQAGQQQDTLLAGAEGVVAPVRSEPTPLWEAHFGGWPVGLTDELVVVEDEGSVVGRDLATGAVRWRGGDDLAGASCQAAERRTVGFWAMRPEPDLHLVCSAPGGPGSTLLALEAATGRRTATVEVQGSAMSWSVHDGDAVVGSVVDGHAVLTRWDPVTGEEVWRTRSAQPVQGSTDASTGISFMDPIAVVEGDLGELVVSLADGTVLDGDERPTSEHVLEDGSRVVFQDRRSRLIGSDGAERFSVDGRLWTPLWVGAAEPVAVVPDSLDRWSVVDAGTGAHLWSRDGTDDRIGLPQMQVMEHLVVGGGARWGTHVVDARTGDPRWSVGSDSDRMSSPAVTDGQRLFLIHPADREDPSSTDRLVAHRLVDGSVDWRVDLPLPAEYVIPAGDTLLVFGPGTVAVYGLR